MFKFAKNLLDRGIQKQVRTEAPSSSFIHHDPSYLEEEQQTDFGPEMTIGVNVTVVGKIAFRSEERRVGKECRL